MHVYLPGSSLGKRDVAVHEFLPITTTDPVPSILVNIEMGRPNRRPSPRWEGSPNGDIGRLGGPSLHNVSLFLEFELFLEFAGEHVRNS
jgi:hypothetical protein